MGWAVSISCRLLYPHAAPITISTPAFGLWDDTVSAQCKSLLMFPNRGGWAAVAKPLILVAGQKRSPSHHTRPTLCHFNGVSWMFSRGSKLQ